MRILSLLSLFLFCSACDDDPGGASPDLAAEQSDGATAGDLAGQLPPDLSGQATADLAGNPPADLADSDQATLDDGGSPVDGGLPDGFDICPTINCKNGGVQKCMMSGCTMCVAAPMGNTMICAK